MVVSLRLSSLAAAALLLISQAKAEDAPADTTTFVSMCTTDFEDCRNKVLMVSNYNRIRIMGGNHGYTFPRTPAQVHADSIAATNAIVDWLKANEAVRAPKTGDAIDQSMAALWPVRALTVERRAA
jgi:hypothetical protein